MIAFIINPVSGNGRGTKVWLQLESTLRRRGISYCARFTTGPGTAGALAAELLLAGDGERPSTVVAVGGDGTVHEIVNGLWQAAAARADGRIGCRFGYIAAGSGNDFARGHGIPLDPASALEVVLEAHTCYEIDLLQQGGRVAVSSVGAGLDGQVALETNRAGYKKQLNRIGLGKLAYVFSLLRVLFSYRPCSVRLRVDGERIEKTRVWLIAVSNIPQYGGGMRINPAALPDDGKAAVCVVSGISRWKLLLLFPLVYSGKHVGHPAVSFHAGCLVEIEPELPLCAHMDGEIADPGPLRVEVLPSRLTIIRP